MSSQLIGGNRDKVLQKYAENKIDGACEKRGSFKKNQNKKDAYTYIQKYRDEISDPHN